MHGTFLLNQDIYIYNQCLNLKYRNLNICISNLLIGDYFVFKTFLPTINYLASTNSTNQLKINPEIKTVSKLISEIIEKESLDSFLLFGVNLINDYHILRNLINNLLPPHFPFLPFSNIINI